MYLYFPDKACKSVTGSYNPELWFEGHNYPNGKSVTKKEGLLFTQIVRQDITKTLGPTLFSLHSI
jgi:hypothetical protein